MSLVNRQLAFGSTFSPLFSSPSQRTKNLSRTIFFTSPRQSQSFNKYSHSIQTEKEQQGGKALLLLLYQQHIFQSISQALRYIQWILRVPMQD